MKLVKMLEILGHLMVVQPPLPKPLLPLPLSTPLVEPLLHLPLDVVGTDLFALELLVEEVVVPEAWADGADGGGCADLC